MDKEEFNELVLTLDALIADSKYIEYLELCEPVIDLGLEFHAYEEIMLIMRQISECYYQLGHVEIAIEKLVPLKKMIEEYGSEEDYIYFLILSYIYWDETGDREYAGAFLYQALPLARQGKYDVMLRKVLNNLTALNIMLGHFDEAEAYALETHELLKKEVERAIKLSPTDYMPPIINYAIILEHQNRLEECERVLQRGFEMLPSKRILSKLNLLFTLSKVRKKQLRLDEQHAILIEARDIALQHRFTTNSIEILKELLSIYRIANDVEQIIVTQAMYIDVLEKSQQREFKMHLMQNDRLSRLSHEQRMSTDPLTKVYNRKYFERSYYSHLKGPQHLFFYIDIAEFKRYNDAHGQLASDDVLKKLAADVNAFFTAHDGLFARYQHAAFCGIVSCDGNDNPQLIDELRQILLQLPVRVVVSIMCFKKRDSLILPNLIEQAKQHITDVAQMEVVHHP